MAALCSSFFVAPPPELYHPVVTAKFGRYVYLTILTNILNTLYFGVYIWSCLFGGATAKAIVIKLFSLSFGLGFFLTLGYYSLDHFNPANAPRMNALMGEYPYIWEAAHVAHGHGLPAVVFHAVTIPVSQFGRRPRNSDVLVFGGAFMVAYLTLLHVNHAYTGAWVYPILEDVERAGGVGAKNVFLFVVSTIILGFAFVGKIIVNKVNTKKKD